MRNLILFLLVAAFACTQTSETSTIVPGDSVALQEDPLTFKADSLVKEVCVDENCAKLRLVWPEASGSEAAEKINAAVRDQLALLVQTGEEAVPLDTLVSRFFRSFKEFKSEFPESGGGWEIDAEGQVSYESDSTLSIHFTQFNFMGGAHPNSSVSFLNFDRQSGEVIGDDRLVKDDSLLFQKVEQKFREFHDVAEGVSLEDDGRFFIPETGFFVAGARGLKDGKFWVVYQPYEISPFVLGYTELEFTRDEIGDLVRW